MSEIRIGIYSFQPIYLFPFFGFISELWNDVNMMRPLIARVYLLERICIGYVSILMESGNEEKWLGGMRSFELFPFISLSVKWITITQHQCGHL